MKLLQVALYAKNWYLRTELISDLIKCLSADGYIIETKYEVFSLITQHASKLFKEEEIDRYSMELTNALIPENTWKNGYFHNQHDWTRNHQELDDYDFMTATIYFYLSKISRSKIDGLSEDLVDSNILSLRK